MQQLAIEIFNVKMRISPILMKDIFSFSANSNQEVKKWNLSLKSGTHLSRPKETIFLLQVCCKFW